MLFSNQDIAEYINQWFEPVWHSLRPVPIVKIDFQNGHVIKRTLQGNIATVVCASDGQVLDVLPGIYSANTYLEQLKKLRDLSILANSKPADRKGFLDHYYRTEATTDGWSPGEQPGGWGGDWGSTGKGYGGSPAIGERIGSRANADDGRGKYPLNGETSSPAFGNERSPANSGVSSPGSSFWNNLLGRKQPEPEPVRTTPPALARRISANPPTSIGHSAPESALRLISKSASQAPLKAVINPSYTPPSYESATPPKSVPDLSAAETAKWEALIQDTLINERLRRDKIHNKLRTGVHQPENIVKWLYREILDSDLDDPYLGLGKQLFDSYPFEK